MLASGSRPFFSGLLNVTEDAEALDRSDGDLLGLRLVLGPWNDLCEQTGDDGRGGCRLWRIGKDSSSFLDHLSMVISVLRGGRFFLPVGLLQFLIKDWFGRPACVGRFVWIFRTLPFRATVLYPVGSILDAKSLLFRIRFHYRRRRQRGLC